MLKYVGGAAQTAPTFESNEENTHKGANKWFRSAAYLQAWLKLYRARVELKRTGPERDTIP